MAAASQSEPSDSEELRPSKHIKVNGRVSELLGFFIKSRYRGVGERATQQARLLAHKEHFIAYRMEPFCFLILAVFSL